MGKEAADRFSLNQGFPLEINGKKFFVAGVLEPTGSQDDNLLFMALPVAQHIFGKQGKIGMVEVAALCKNCPISDIVTQISEKMPTAKVTAVQQVVEGRMGTLHSFRKFSLGISGLVLLVGSMVVFVTMMASVNEAHERDRHIQRDRVPQNSHNEDYSAGGAGRIIDGRCCRLPCRYRNYSGASLRANRTNSPFFH